jgi:hypothetical protein
MGNMHKNGLPFLNNVLCLLSLIAKNSNICPKDAD